MFASGKFFTLGFFDNCGLYSCQTKYLDEFEMLPTTTVHLLILILTFLQLFILHLFVQLSLYLTQLVSNYLYLVSKNYFTLPVCTTFNSIYLKYPFSFLLILKIRRSFSTTFLWQFRVPRYTKSSTCVTRIPQRAPSFLFQWNIALS